MDAGAELYLERPYWSPGQGTNERLPSTVAGLRFMAFACLMLTRAFTLLLENSKRL